MREQAGEAARQVHESDALDVAARAGLVAYGLVHLVIGVLAVQLALGDRSGSSDSTGALHELAGQPLGGVVVWAVALGMWLLVVWRLLEAAFGERGRGADDGEALQRVAAVGKAVLYGALALTATRVAAGDADRSGGDSTDPWTARLMDAPGGQLLVGAVGAAVLAYGGYLVVRGWTDRFARRLEAGATSGHVGRALLWTGRVGHVAKGVALAVVGVLFVSAAVQHDPKESGGLDQALRRVLEQPFGPALLTLIGVGIACYGLFAFARARHFTR